MRTQVPVFFLALLALPGRAQQQWFESPESFFKSSGQVLTFEQMCSQQAVSQTKTAAREGGGVPTAALVTSGDVVFRGEEYSASLIVKQTLPVTLYIYARLFYPGAFGNFAPDSRQEVFPVMLGDGTGKFRQGIVEDEVVPVYTPRITPNFQPGEYMLDVVIADNFGVVIFEAYSRFNVLVRLYDPKARPFSVSAKVQVQYLGFTANYTSMYLVVLSGRFPKDVPVDITATLPGLKRFDNSAVSSDGTTLRFRYETAPVFRPSALNLTLYSSFFREAITLRHGLDLDAQ